MAEAAQVDNTMTEPGRPAVLMTGEQNLASVTQVVSRVGEAPRPPRAWYIAFGISSALTLILLAMITYLFVVGVGIWGIMIPAAWGFAIVNFVFWIGIGHAGTLISAILFLFRQKWRTAINRSAEAMTIFAVVCAGMFPILHLGRPWYAYWLLPYPNYMMVWPQFRSPLIWDVFAVSTYMTVSILFWYMGMIPDLATFRDRARTRLKHAIYGILSLGWRGSGRHWHRYETAYLVLAALATPLVLSVHSVVSFDFAVAQLPGWHTTIFPPYFVAGAIFSGFAMVLTLIIPARQYLGLKDLVTLRHLDNMAKILLATGLIVAYSYGVEFWTSWYSGNPYDMFATVNRVLGPYAWAYWIMIACNVVVPQFLWFKRVRTSLLGLWIVSLLVNVGMWFERFVIIVASLGRDFLPSSWGYYRPTWVDLLTLAGSFGLFLTLFLLFVRYLPIVAMAEVKSIMPEAHLEHGEHHGLGQYWGEIPHHHEAASQEEAP
jgi:Ni/Fe-hydrogenase subunit HybB-like protein